jgi:hypothetical protein
VEGFCACKGVRKPFCDKGKRNLNAGLTRAPPTWHAMNLLVLFLLGAAGVLLLLLRLARRRPKA